MAVLKVSAVFELKRKSIVWNCCHLQEKALWKRDDLVQMASNRNPLQLYVSNNPSKVIIGRDLDFLQNDESLRNKQKSPIVRTSGVKLA